MKKGDIVTIRDSSYSNVITEHGLESSYCGLHSVRNEQGTVIELDCEFPDGNNTVVRTNSGKVVFIEERFLKLVAPKHLVWIDIRQDSGWMYGQIVEISDKLYKEIKRESQTQ